MGVAIRAIGKHWLLLACLLPIAAVAHGHDAHGQTDHRAAGTALAARAAFDADGRLWVVGVRGGHVELRHSDDFGKSFSAPMRVNAKAENIATGDGSSPDLAVATDGQIHVAWARPLELPWTSDVRYARSADRGTTFSDPVSLGGSQPTGSRGFNAMALAGDDSLLVAWINNGDTQVPKLPDTPHRGVIDVVRSADGGKSFSAPHELAERSCECCSLALATTPAGDVEGLFRAVYGDNIRDHAHAVLSGDAIAPPQRVTFSQWQIAACPEHGPGLAVGDDGVRHAVWYEASDGPALWYGQIDPGKLPRHPRRIGAAGASRPAVAVRGSTVWLAYNQVSAEGHALTLLVSRDNGESFAEPVVIATSDVAVNSPQLLVHDGQAWVAWNTANGFRLMDAEALP